MNGVSRASVQGWFFAVALGMLVGVGDRVAPAQQVGNRPAPEGGELPRLNYLTPGMRVGDEAPPNWSHLVVRSIPRLASGDLGTLPASAAGTATLIHTVMAARVQRSRQAPDAFVLNRVGIGLCIPLSDGRDIVVTSAKLEALGVSLSGMQRLVLRTAEGELSRGRLTVRTPSFALFRTPATLLLGGQHRKVDLFYALLVDAATGRLQVAVWPLDADPAARRTPTKMDQLGPSPTFDCALDVQASRILGAVPYSWSFAMRGLPPGQLRPVPPDLGRLMLAAARVRIEPAELERGLRATLDQYGEARRDEAVRPVTPAVGPGSDRGAVAGSGLGRSD